MQSDMKTPLVLLLLVSLASHSKFLLTISVFSVCLVSRDPEDPGYFSTLTGLQTCWYVCLCVSIPARSHVRRVLLFRL